MRIQTDLNLKRDVRISEPILYTYSHTEAWPGCEAKIDGTAQRAHTVECRRRIKNEMAKGGLESEVFGRRNERASHQQEEVPEVPKDDKEDLPE